MKSDKKGAQRTCVACREALDKNQMIRYVVAPDGKVLVDYRQKLPGRGAYTCVNTDCISKAITRQAFSRSFRGRCKNIDYDDLEAQLLKAVECRIEGLLGMARKAGIVTSGSSMVLAQLRKAQCDFGLIMLANDISEDIGNKIEAAAGRRQITCIRVFNKDKIGQILGKEERSVVGFLSGALVEAMLTELSRYRLLAREN